MRKPKRKTILAPERLALLVVSLEIINELLELLSKVVNYGSAIRELRVQLQE